MSIKKNEQKLFIEKAVLCEDVRIETQGKHTLTGVFAGDLLAAEFPAKIRMAAYIVLSVAEKGLYSFKIRATFDKTEIAHLDGNANAETLNPIVVVIPIFYLSAASEGVFRIELSVGGDDWIPVTHTHIRKPPTLPSASIAVPSA